LILFWSFVSAVGVGLFTWGSPASPLILGFAFLTHVTSASDAIRQASFPGFGRWVPAMSASAGLGFGCYLPALALATVVAWPGPRDMESRNGFLVNRWAYRKAEPRLGESICFHAFDSRGTEMGQVVAGPGQTVEVREGRMTVDGSPLRWEPSKAAWLPEKMALIVPPDHVLVACRGDEARVVSSSGLVLVPRGRVIGRAWAQYAPIWKRKLL
jgi:hypothetical protein